MPIRPLTSYISQITSHNQQQEKKKVR